MAFKTAVSAGCLGSGAGAGVLFVTLIAALVAALDAALLSSLSFLSAARLLAASASRSLASLAANSFATASGVALSFAESSTPGLNLSWSWAVEGWATGLADSLTCPVLLRLSRGLALLACAAGLGVLPRLANALRQVLKSAVWVATTVRAAVSVSLSVRVASGIVSWAPDFNRFTLLPTNASGLALSSAISI